MIERLKNQDEEVIRYAKDSLNNLFLTRNIYTRMYLDSKEEIIRNFLKKILGGVESLINKLKFIVKRMSSPQKEEDELKSYILISIVNKEMEELLGDTEVLKKLTAPFSNE